MSEAPPPYPLPPPPPSPTAIALWAGQLRVVIPLLGGIGIGGAWLQSITDTQLTSYVTTGLTLFGLVCWIGTALWARAAAWWRAADKRKAEVSAAVASANATHAIGVPTAVTVIPSTPTTSPTAVTVPYVEAVAAAVPPVGKEIQS